MASIVVATVALNFAPPARAQIASDGYDIMPLHQGGGLGTISAMFADPTGKIYLGCNTGTGRLWELDPGSGVLRRVVEGLPLSSPMQIVLGDGSALLGSELVVADQNTEINVPCCDGNVLRVDRATGSASVAVGSLTGVTDDPSGIAIGRGSFSAALYIMNQQGASADTPKLFEVSSAGDISIFAQNSSLWPGTRNPSRIVIDPHGHFAGDLFVVDRSSDTGGDGVVWRVNPAGIISSFSSSQEIAGVIGLGFAPVNDFGTDLYIVCGNQPNQTPRVWRLHPDSSRELVASDFPAVGGGFAGLCFSPDGTAMYVGVDDRVWVVRRHCTADFNADGSVNSQDFFDFLGSFFASAPDADFNHDGNINSQDFFDFLAAFFAGC